MATVAVVTGAGSGMGRACADRLVEEVDALVLVDRNEASLVEAAGVLAAAGPEVQIETLTLDVTDVDGLARLARLVSELGTLRAVAHAAGISPHMANWRDVLTVDLVGTARLVAALAPLTTMNTVLVCFASIGADLGTGDVAPDALSVLDEPLAPGFVEKLHDVLNERVEQSDAAYCWAKLGVRRLVKREAAAFGQRGARIVSVSPGMIDTPMTRMEAEALGMNKIMVELTPLNREGLADEVAAVVAFLVSEEAAFVTGVDVPVDGGLVAQITTGSSAPVEGE